MRYIYHNHQGYFTGTGAIIWFLSAGEVTLKDMGKTNCDLVTPYGFIALS